MIKFNYKESTVSLFLVASLTFALIPAVRDLEVHAQQAGVSPAANNPAVNKAELHQALLDLTSADTVMCVAAHPDDEDGTTLTVLRRKYGVHTVSLFSTFGEGGQNAVGPELYEALGIIRTEETRAAAAIQGSEPYFLGLKDFGFSKSSAEAFKFWGHEEALKRMVLKIRELRPDAVITHHDTTSGHGHHQATGQLILEAFDAAADPKRFPEQLAQFQPWQIKRLFVRSFAGGGGQQPGSQGRTEKSFAIDPNEVDAVRGASFAEQALSALQQHASQGPWPRTVAEMIKARRINSDQLPLIRYTLVREAKGAPPLPLDATTPIAGLEDAEPSESIAADIAPAKIDGRPLTDFADAPDRVLASLVDWRAGQTGSDSNSAEPHRQRLIEERINKAIALAAGVSLSLISRPAVLVPGVNTTFSIAITNSGARTVAVNGLRFKSSGDDRKLKVADQLLPDTETIVTVDRATPKTASLTTPREEHLYDNLPPGRRFEAVAALEVDGAKFTLSTILEREVAPAVEIRSISPSPYVWTPATRNQPLTFTVTLVSHLDAPFTGNLTMSSRERHSFQTGRKLTLTPLETREVVLKSSASPFGRGSVRRAQSAPAEVVISVDSVSSHTVTQRAVRMVYSDARVAPSVRVGFVRSFDETLAKSLAALGVNSDRLSVEDIQRGDLNAYQTIIIDNRGYEAHPELIAANSRLLDFVNAGGTLIVCYHKDNEWNPDPKKNRPQLAPYPITLGGERVTVESAPIQFSQPRHPLLNFPNRITATDFNDWIQERGLYYPKVWDPHYAAIFATNDPGESPLTGGLLVAQSGKGNYIYTSMVWYRQLRAGVPGAYRMFANMISYGHERAPGRN